MMSQDTAAVLFKYLPANYIEVLNPYINFAHEIRLSAGHALMVYTGKMEFIPKTIVTREDITATLSKMSGGALYSVQDKLSQGFLTIEGGHRVGVCGRTTLNNGKVVAVSDISAINIRIARQITSAAATIWGNVFAQQVSNTLIIGRPGCGKTTLLRDITRRLASAPKFLRVAVADERGEISAPYMGKPTLDIGETAVVMDGCPKAVGLNMLLRSMSPDVCVADELGSQEDCEAILDLCACGVKVVCTAHADSLDDVRTRSYVAPLVAQNIFKSLIHVRAPNRYDVEVIKSVG